MTRRKDLREKVIDAAREYYNEFLKQDFSFNEGDKIPYGGRVYDENELVNLIDSSLDFWLTSGRYVTEFEGKFSKLLDVRYCSLVNSGSSANLIAFMTLTSPKLGERRVKKGDEVITVVAGFPTTVTPVIQYGAIPVFVDVTLPTYNIDVSELKKALSSKTKAVMVAHTLGNPFDLKAVKDFCDENDLWLIEDNCDALGSKYNIDGEWKYTGTIGDIATSSFYPPHHFTMGEGGAVYTNNSLLYLIANSFRDWGRDCWCGPGKDDTCRMRFTKKYGDLPLGYDHKYVYSHFGYNLKLTDMQAAVGCAQLEKFELFGSKRRENWKMFKDGLAGLEDKLILPEPTENSDPSWFGFLITVRSENGIKRDDIVNHLEDKGIQTRMLFAGNLIKHPCFDEMRASGEGYRVVGDLKNADRIMNDTFWVGVYPGMTEEKIDYIISKIREITN